MRTFLAVLLSASLAMDSVAYPAPPQKRLQVHGEGCVEPGVESRCLVVKDVRTGAMFGLFFRGIQPALGTGIDFSGVPHHGVTTCNQGAAVDVLTWAHKDLKCTEGTAPKPRTY